MTMRTYRMPSFSLELDCTSIRSASHSSWIFMTGILRMPFLTFLSSRCFCSLYTNLRHSAIVLSAIKPHPGVEVCSWMIISVILMLYYKRGALFKIYFYFYKNNIKRRTGRHIGSRNHNVLLDSFRKSLMVTNLDIHLRNRSGGIMENGRRRERWSDRNRSENYILYFADELHSAIGYLNRLYQQEINEQECDRAYFVRNLNKICKK